MNENIQKIMKELQKPFREDELEFRVGSTNQDKSMGLALAYVEARAIQTRLDAVLGVDSWKVSYREITNGFIAKLEIKINGEWIGKEDGAASTEYESVKGGISSAFKRVASSGFGIGRYLYGVKSQWHPIKQQGKSYAFVGVPKLGLETTKEPKEEKDVPVSEEARVEKLKSIKLTFGKYSGKTLGEVEKLDKKYLLYLIEKSSDKQLVEACTILGKVS